MKNSLKKIKSLLLRGRDGRKVRERELEIQNLRNLLQKLDKREKKRWQSLAIRNGSALLR